MATLGAAPAVQRTSAPVVYHPAVIGFAHCLGPTLCDALVSLSAHVRLGAVPTLDGSAAPVVHRAALVTSITRRP